MWKALLMLLGSAEGLDSTARSTNSRSGDEVDTSCRMRQEYSRYWIVDWSSSKGVRLISGKRV
eukprot:1039472-Pyramimonas_sp.AAC.1